MFEVAANVSKLLALDGRVAHLDLYRDNMRIFGLKIVVSSLIRNRILC